MRLSLDDIKKTITRRGGQPFLTPYLLRPGELEAPIGALIGLHDTWLGRPRASFPDDRPSELIGDYRLARSLVACLSEWYEWRSPAWPGVADTAEAQALAERGIASPSDLRLALYDHVNAVAGGYLPTDDRESTLDACAATCGLRRSTFDALLDLDADDRAALARTADAAPSAWDLAARYNQRAVEALLFSAASVEWHIPADATDGSGGGLGTVVKRICFLARTMGVQYDVAFEQPTATDDVPGYDLQLRRVAERGHPYALTSLDSLRRPLSITLYGPQEVMGSPNQYGERLARLCRALLGYRRQRAGKAALSSKGLRGAARVYLHGRPVTFLLDDQLLALMDASSPASQRQPFSLAGPLEPNDAAFDSSLERMLHDEFTALERAGEAHGWRLEREPEPLIVGETILVPDFAVTRGFKRVYLEIAGYWRPGYRERKARKLNALRDSVSQLVAAPESARADFAALAPTIPVLWYANRVSAAALLALLDRAYDDFAQRLAALDPTHIRAEIQTRGCVPPTEAFALLHCYTRTELAATLAHINSAAPDDANSTHSATLVGEGVQASLSVLRPSKVKSAGATDGTTPSLHWIDGLGLCSSLWLDTLQSHIRDLVESAPDSRLSLTALTQRIAAELRELRDASPASIELLASHAGLTVARASIFDVEIVSPHAAPASTLASADASAASTTARSGQPSQPRGSVRRKQQQKAPQPAYTATSIFSLIPSERPGNDDTEPDTPSRAREQMPGDAAEGGAQ